MWRWVKIGFVVLPWVLLGIGWIWWQIMRERLDLDGIGADSAHFTNATEFEIALGFRGCVTMEAAIAEARARDLRWITREGQDFGYCIRPDSMTRWLGVTIDPPRLFSNDEENRRWLGFDVQGCMARWHYGGGPGSTCP